ncbi:MAG: small multi-drug export protein [Candidatus Undinarchaeales archaeon]
MNPLLYVIILSISPFFELRGAIPTGIALGLDPAFVFVVSVAINILIIPILFFILDQIFDEITFIHKLADRIHNRAEKYVEKYGYIGLMLFVSVPLPGSGAYSGSIVAHLFEMERKKSMVAIAAGVLIAGTIITLASTGALAFAKIFILK